MKKAAPHFCARVRERLEPIFGPICPHKLAAAISSEIKSGTSPHIQYQFRVSRNGRRVWRCDVMEGQHFYAMVDHREDDIVPITVFTPGMRLARQGKHSVLLK